MNVSEAKVSEKANSAIAAAGSKRPSGVSTKVGHVKGVSRGKQRKSSRVRDIKYERFGSKGF